MRGVFGDNPRVVFRCERCGTIGLFNVKSNEELEKLMEEHKFNGTFGW